MLQLRDVRSPNDKKYTLMHHLAEVVRCNYSDLLVFCNELRYLEKASSGTTSLLSLFLKLLMYNVHKLCVSIHPVNLDLLGGDLRELIQGMKLATGELINNKQNRRLKVSRSRQLGPVDCVYHSRHSA